MRVLVFTLVACARGTGVLEAALLASKHATAPFVHKSPAPDAHPNVTLRAVLEPFANRLRPPYVKFTRGDGEALDRTLSFRRGQSRSVRHGRWKWLDGRLFDLDADPRETTDLAGEHPAVAGRLATVADG